METDKNHKSSRPNMSRFRSTQVIKEKGQSILNPGAALNSMNSNLVTLGWDVILSQKASCKILENFSSKVQIVKNNIYFFSFSKY